MPVFVFVPSDLVLAMLVLMIAFVFVFVPSNALVLVAMMFDLAVSWFVPVPDLVSVAVPISDFRDVYFTKC